MIGIVVVGYNRPESMRMLLKSVVEADYLNDKVDLIISIDKSKNQKEVIDVAQNVKWDYGEKIIRTFEERQGLRSHILQCGDLTVQYDAVIVLEDDLIVSKAFYKYAKAAVEFYEDDERIAGISLYSYPANEFCDELFVPTNNGYDTFMMQVAQSWGQCWTKSMWCNFKKWKYHNADILPEGYFDMPPKIYHWGKTSWKKNYMAYLVDTEKFFVYPYFSYTTNRSEIGTHRNVISSDYQVPLAEDGFTWNFAPFDKAIRYDIYFERIGLQINDAQFRYKKVKMDLYGLKSNFEEAEIIFSRKALPFRKIKEIGLNFKPMEKNCEMMVEGKGLAMYDATVSDEIRKIDNEFLIYEYNAIMPNWHRGIKYYCYGFQRAIRRKLGRILKK